MFTYADIGYLKFKGLCVLGCYDWKLNFLSKCVENSQYQISLNLSSMKQAGMLSVLCGFDRISAT